MTLWALTHIAAGLFPTPALAWELFRSENKDARKANELLQQGKPEEAEKLLDDAARALPNHPGVHFNRGLALMKRQKLAEAREAFRLATQGEADAQLRANAHYNMGLAFMGEADAAAQGEQLDQAQSYLREAVDAFKHSLRNVPKNRDAAWNLEVAKRRLEEVERQKQEREDQKKQQEEQEKQEKSEDSQEPQDGEPQDSDDSQQKQDGDSQGEPGDRKQDSENGEQNANAPEGEDTKADPEAAQKPADAQPDKGQESGQGEQDKAEQKPEDKAPQPEAQPQQGKQPEAKDKQGQASPPAAPEGARGEPALPEHMQKALDALSESDENLQKHRARTRSHQRPRRIEKDW